MKNSLDRNTLKEFIQTEGYAKVFPKNDIKHIFLLTRWRAERNAYHHHPEIYLDLKELFVRFLNNTNNRRQKISSICSKCHQCCGGNTFGNSYMKSTCNGFDKEPLLCLNAGCLSFLCRPLLRLLFSPEEQAIFTWIEEITNPVRSGYWSSGLVKLVETKLMGHLGERVCTELDHIAEDGLYPLLFPKKES